MLNWLRDLLQPIRVTDPVLGPLRYLRDTRTWEGWIDFRPVGHPVEVLLSGGPTGPEQAQKSLLQELAEKYVVLLPSVLGMLNDSAATHGMQGRLSFKLVAIDLPELAGAAWELCFETEPPSAFYVVQMNGFSPVSASVEC